ADTTANDGKKQGKYPPIEYMGNGYYRAYKNHKKVDSWILCESPGGEWQVVSDMAINRAYRTHTPKFFKSLDDVIKKYPAFEGIKEAIAQNQGNESKASEVKVAAIQNDVPAKDQVLSDIPVVSTYTDQSGQVYASVTRTKDGTYKVILPHGVSDELLDDKEVADFLSELKATDAPYLKYDNGKKYELTDQSEVGIFEYWDFARDFIKDNYAKAQALGVTEGDLEEVSENEHRFTHGPLEGLSLFYVAMLFRLVDATALIGADIVIDDFNKTEHLNSIFDGLDHDSKPTEGITAQIANNEALVRAKIDNEGKLTILLGASGGQEYESVNFIVKDNTTAIKEVLMKALETEQKNISSRNDAQDSESIVAPDAQVATEHTNSETKPGGELNQRVKDLEDTVNNPDWLPTDFDEDAYEKLYNEVSESGDSDLLARLEAIIPVYEKRLFGDAIGFMNEATA
ncbi:MAG: hypothetical protein Q4P13_05840, partial [Psychrobacter sp.]|nr:hypothetical protein [Psychrobacter sp.]